MGRSMYMHLQGLPARQSAFFAVIVPFFYRRNATLSELIRAPFNPSTGWEDFPASGTPKSVDCCGIAAARKTEGVSVVNGSFCRQRKETGH